MDIGSLTFLIKDNARSVGAVVFLVIVSFASASIGKVILSRKSKDTSIKIGKINGNNNSIAGRDVTKN